MITSVGEAGRSATPGQAKTTRRGARRLGETSIASVADFGRRAALRWPWGNPGRFESFRSHKCLCSPMVEAGDLKSLKRRFDPDRKHTASYPNGRGGGLKHRMSRFESGAGYSAPSWRIGRRTRFRSGREIMQVRLLPRAPCKFTRPRSNATKNHCL